MNTKIFLTSLCLALILNFSLVAGGSQEETTSQHTEEGLPNLEGRVIVAVTSNDYPPLSMIDPSSGESIGWEYDVTNEIARRINARIEWNLASWDTMLAAVQIGQYDVAMDGITINDKRREVVDFSRPYLRSEQFMLVRADENRFDSSEAFASDNSLLVGAIPGTTNFYTAVYNVLDGNESNKRIILFNNFGALVQSLIVGDVDLVLMDAASSRGYIGANPGTLKTVGGPLASEDFGYAFAKESDLVEAFNLALDSMEEDGTLNELTRYWFFEHSFSGE